VSQATHRVLCALLALGLLAGLYWLALHVPGMS
jgi:hypothetical protein